MSTRATLWHQPDVMAQRRQAIRAAGAGRCPCGQPATVLYVQSIQWRCAACAQRDFESARQRAEERYNAFLHGDQSA